MKKIYVASSWSNGELLDEVHAALRARGFETLDFRAQGRWWSGPADQASEVGDVDPLFGRIATPEGRAAFEFDFGLMKEADACFAVHPCGIAVSLEVGWFTGAGKPVVVWRREVRKPLDITWLLARWDGLHLGSDLDVAIDAVAVALDAVWRNR